ncbi:MAG TPA: DegT/DnrJ/EryC1/StrS family aminotransferase [Candidatus Binatia bacterium]
MPAGRIRFIDLPAQYATLAAEIRAAVDEVFAAQAFVLGPTVERFEAALAEYLGAAAVVGVASGTDALYLALRALEVGPGDAVVTTPFSFVATGTAIARVGARPIFLDIDRDSFNLDPAGVAQWIGESCRRDGGGELRTIVGERVRVVLPTHLYGRICDMDAFERLAEREELDVVEDAAQAIGARLPDGRAAGAIGQFGCISFYPTKNLGGAGDGGAVVCRNANDAALVRMLARHGAEGSAYRHVELGLASRLDALQAAVLAVKLPRLDAWNEARRRHAARYEECLAAAFGADGPVRAPGLVPGHVYHQYVVRVPERERVRAALAANGIETQVYYPIPLHLQPCFVGLEYRPGELPEAERASREALALPIYPELAPDAPEIVVASLARALGVRP